MASPYRGSRLGTRFGPYQLQSLVGEGGMGEVYQAYDTVKGRTVALKLLRAGMAGDPGFQERFRRESRIAARLTEPHVIPVHDFGEIDGVLYIDMRLVEGANLKEVLRSDGPLEPRRAAAIITQVAAALDAAHADGLVHRDIKPENVLLTADDFAYLADFGIAHAQGNTSVTMTGSVVGSADYIAPERFGAGVAGREADVYSLTCVLYECLTGRPPFETGDLAQLINAHVLSPPPRPSIMRRGIGREFDAVIARGMAKQPEARFASAGDLARAATAAASTQGPPGRAQAAVAAPPAGPAPGTRQFSAIYPNPAETGHSPYPLPARAPVPPVRTAGLSRVQRALIAGTALTLGGALVVATVLLLRNGIGGSPVTPPSASQSTSAVSPRMTTVSPTFSGADAQGFLNQAARCDSGDLAAAMMRTASSLAVICQSAPNDFYYHGQRLSDGANLRLAGAVPVDGGFDVTNPDNGARYEVRPDRLTIISNGHVDSSEAPVQYASG
ncbi:serine/threonine-protein kinase [Mycolicibacterium hodleri]|uniref:non-specific serine/threonine protein kinase n=1 Tax=Mycolicibacterium hodleri TaxID=49897 RepID=A0A502EBD9_9MYCO|nr:serine/threonine-protein kinase [Mycolicibacterium hodleri]TPG33780.1 serine/threonine protein kinase [Mycolicibacterium hodleri]